MVKQILVFFIFLASAVFFKFTYLPKSVVMLLSFGGIILMGLTIAFFLIYDRGTRFKQHFSIEVGIMFFALLLATFGAKYGHNQDFYLTAWVQYPMYFYLFYFFLHAIRFRPDDLEKLMIYMAVLFISLFVIQYVLYPTILFGGRVQEARGTIRIFLPGSAFAGLMYFYFLHQILTKNKLIYIVFCFIFLAIPFLQGTRSSIVTTLFGTLLYIVVSRQVRSKIVVTMLLMVGAILVYIVFQDIIMTLVEVSQEQAAQDDDDIRVRSAKFYLYEFYPSKLNYITGNGQSHMASPYGMRVWYYKDQLGYYQNDIGMLGQFTKYGIFYVISVILMLRKIFIRKIEPRYAYIKYWAVLIVLAELMGGAFANPTAIVVLTSVMYIYDISYFELINPKKKEEDKTEEGALILG